MSKWISADDCLPNEGEFVMTCIPTSKGGVYSYGMYLGVRGWHIVGVHNSKREKDPQYWYRVPKCRYGRCKV